MPYRCHIQEMRPDGGPCLVFIEELGEKRVVNYEQLEPLPVNEAQPWAPPYRYSRAHSQILTISQMLQQIGSFAFLMFVEFMRVIFFSVIFLFYGYFYPCYHYQLLIY